MRYIDCLSQGRNFRNFAFQVQMTIIKGDWGGIFFRSDSESSKFYFFAFQTDGQYALALQIDRTQPSVQFGLSSSLKKGVNQSNLITVVAYGHDFYVYVNKQYVDHLSNNTLSSGAVGVFAQNLLSPSTDVAFSNAQVWVLA